MAFYKTSGVCKAEGVVDRYALHETLGKVTFKSVKASKAGVISLLNNGSNTATTRLSTYQKDWGKMGSAQILSPSVIYDQTLQSSNRYLAHLIKYDYPQ